MRDSRPKLYTIPASTGFSDCLAEGLLARYGPTAEDPLRLARVTLFLPTRRAVRSVRDALLRKADGVPMILPVLMALGDLGGDDEALEGDASLLKGQEELDLRPAIPPLKRRFLLARLILTWASAQTGSELAMTPAQALALAGDLMVFMDQAMAEEVDLERLPVLAPDRFSRHWQDTVTFLDIVTTAWPAILDDLGMMDAVARRIRVLGLLQAGWEADPPQHPVLAAGSTGSVPSTAKLLGAIARLPHGAVILPGLDLDLEEDTFLDLEAAHPQFGMKELILRMGAHRSDVNDWVDEEETPDRTARARLINEALRPPDSTELWQTFRKNPTELASGVKNIQMIEAADGQAEASAIALIMREGLETEGQTIALISPDQFLARRVESALRRWGIEVDSSAGRPLEKTVPATFLRSLAGAVSSDFASVPLLALLKHPLCAVGLARPEHLRLVRRLERAVLRGVRIAGGLTEIRHRLVEQDAAKGGLGDLVSWFDDWVSRLDPVREAVSRIPLDPRALFEGMLATAEALAETDTVSGDRLIWQGEAGESLSRLLSDFLDHADDCPGINAGNWSDVLDTLMLGQSVRPQYGTHPRLFIWGPLEARLQRADIVILGGLNEGVWPQIPDTGPWLSRPMNEDLGLLPPERRLGLSAHDFFQGACAPKVYLTRARKVDGEPKNASRWILRLQTLLETMGQELTRNTAFLAWAQALDRPDAVAPARAPEPRPPVADRPRDLSVTRVGEWVRDPYGIYARKVLGLVRLDDVDEDPGALQRGNLIHEILEHFLKDHEALLRDGDRQLALDSLMERGREAFTHYEQHPEVKAFWWARFERLAPWFIDHERGRTEPHRVAGLEVKATYSFDGPAGPFELSGTADRLDYVGEDLSIYDYKTGTASSYAQVLAGFAPQLTLEAWMAREGAFPGIAPRPIRDLAYIRLSGGRKVGEERKVEPGRSDDIKMDPMELSAAAFEGLKKYVVAFDDEAMPYRSRVRPQFDATPYDYDHLARVKEWQEEGGGDD